MDATFYQGLAANLPSTKTPGAIYFLTDTKEIYFDKDASTRVLMGSSDVDWENILNKPFEDVEIVTAAQMQTMLDNETWEQGVFYLIPEDEWEDLTNPLAVNKGGTGADNALSARANLGVYSTTEVDTAIGNKANKYAKATLTLTASNWTLNSSTTFYEYDLTGTYPSASYDLEVDLNWDSASEDAASDWASCQIVGSYSSNKLVARGGQPTENYPIIIYATPIN